MIFHTCLPAVPPWMRTGKREDKEAAIVVINTCAFRPYSSASLNVISITSTFLNRLSLNAPKTA